MSQLKLDQFRRKRLLNMKEIGRNMKEPDFCRRIALVNMKEPDFSINAKINC